MKPDESIHDYDQRLTRHHRNIALIPNSKTTLHFLDTKGVLESYILTLSNKYDYSRGKSDQITCCCALLSGCIIVSALR
ncbi:MAG: hypothetical protein LBH74_05265 [Nitrososphaerota archaeon]|uniref:hypothetical protein n=1 Tax=Candidatus Bathycorpusculum sp. TaxID=2994959 RepID=UPI002824D085|nr:hypothetical protein [Candidatus Termitimicrobium sp.]MCL2432572.1 hypothetical protein [Candidatus Termitimicrobium sp.]MDR0493027.1 hypothetical protein [Nitrososphaerota archaeon]